MTAELRFLLWVAVLAALLFYPVARLVWVLSVRRLERRRGERLSDEERRGQRRRAFLLSAVVSTLFSALYNIYLMRVGGDG